MMTESMLLQLWERCYAASPLERTVMMSSLVEPRMSIEEILDLPLGARDQRLIALRRSRFGDDVVSMVSCPNCQTQIELSFDLSQLAMAANTTASAPFEVDWNDRPLMVRCPSTRDVMALATSSSPEALLLERCIISRPEDGNVAPLADESLRRKLGTVIEEHDPLGVIEFEMQCGDCGRQAMTLFDIGRFLWTEIDAWCQRLLSDIHSIARAYGWSESEILSLGAWRRQVYLNMIRH
ncbi:MAG: hypothetical protein WCI02_02720 [Planctomycetota bacterium]